MRSRVKDHSGIPAVLALFAAASATSACTPSLPDGAATAVPCAAAQTVELGRLARNNSATFTADGSTVYFSATGFHHDKPFDPKVGSLELQIGVPSAPPTYDAAQLDVGNLVERVPVVEGQYTPWRPAACAHWISSTGLQPVYVTTCAPQGITNIAAPTSNPTASPSDPAPGSSPGTTPS